MSSSYAVLAQDRASARLRGALYALVTALLVFILAVSEWDVGRLLSAASRATSISVEILIAVALAFVFRAIGGRLEGAVENAFNARRHSARKALLALARNVAHIKDRDDMLRQIVESIDRYVSPDGCAVYLKESVYHAAVSSFAFEARDVADDDELVEKLRAASAPLNPRTFSSTAPGTMACPMMACAELVGFLIVSAQIEHLEAEDRQTIMALAQSAGLALAVLMPSLVSPSQRTLSERLEGNLPHEFASLVGRASELGEIANLLVKHRVICLKGPGGIGKSRLAIRAATDARPQYEGGAWFIDLSPIEDEGQMLASIASMFGITQAAGKTQFQNVVDYVGERKMLLVVDNCEHLIDAVAHVVHDLLRNCPHVRIVATSRERLGLHGESLFEVPPLPRSQAAILFRERAAEVAPAIRIDESSDSVARIISRLDGIPFAIELAAARLRVLSLDELAKRIGNLFQTLSGGSRTALAHQQTLHAMLDWSYALLSEPEKLLFGRLGVFEATFSLDAAARICSNEALAEDDVVGMLGQLVDKSLVQVEAGPNGQRFRLLESGRAYAREVAPLDLDGDLRGRHADFYYHQTETAIENPAGANYDIGLDQLKIDIENVYGAFEWLMQRPGLAQAVTLADHLAHYWFHYTQLRTGREWLQKLLTREDDMTPRERAQSHFAYACMMLFSNPDVALASASLTVEIARQIGDKRLLAKGLGARGNAQLSLGEYDGAGASYEEGAAIYDEIESEHAVVMRVNVASLLINYNEQELDRAQSLLEVALAGAERAGKKGLEGIILGNMAQLAHTQGRMEDAYSLSRRSVEIARTLGAKQQEAVWLYWLGIYSTQLGRRDEAADVLRQAIVICRDIIADDPEHLTGCLEAVLIFAASDGRLLDAARIHGFIESFRHDRGLPRPPVLQSRYDTVLSGVRSGLGEDEFSTNAVTGSKRTALELLDEAILMFAPQSL